MSEFLAELTSLRLPSLPWSVLFFVMGWSCGAAAGFKVARRGTIGAQSNPQEGDTSTT
jgi:hypothetical protein